MITDVFGQRTLVERGDAELGRQLDLVGHVQPVAARHRARSSPPLPQHLFLPAGAGHGDRRRAARVGGARARRVRRHGLGRGAARARRARSAARTATQAARRFTRRAGQRCDPPTRRRLRMPTRRRWRYALGTEVPESWIPFLPVHKPADTREIRLQRGVDAALRAGDGGTARLRPQPVRPRTSILRPRARTTTTQVAAVLRQRGGGAARRDQRQGRAARVALARRPDGRLARSHRHERPRRDRQRPALRRRSHRGIRGRDQAAFTRPLLQSGSLRKARSLTG